MPNACLDLAEPWYSHRSGRYRGTICKSPTTVSQVRILDLPPKPQVKLGARTGLSDVGERCRTPPMRPARAESPACRHQQTAGDQPECENTRSGPPLRRERRAARSVSCAKYVLKRSPPGRPRGRGTRAGLARGGQGGMVLSRVRLAHGVIMSRWRRRAAENGLCTYRRFWSAGCQGVCADDGAQIVRFWASGACLDTIVL
jgi:hypothetical protein